MIRATLSRIVIFTYCICTALLPSCSDDAPKLSAVKAFVMLDFQTATSAPTAKLAVFVGSDSDIRRAQSIKVASEGSGYEWRAENPVRFTGNDSQWTGFTDFVCPQNALPPAGSYSVFYTDARDRQEQADFIIHYPESITHIQAADAEAFSVDERTNYLAVYDKNNALIFWGADSFFGERDAIFSMYHDAAYYRKCFELTRATVLCLLPPVTRDHN